MLTMPVPNLFLDTVIPFTTLISTSFFPHVIPAALKIIKPNFFIKGYEYLAAHLHLGQHMHALQMRDDVVQPQPPVIDEMPAYPVRAENYQPAVTSITEILCESIQASNAPSAAIPAAT